MIKLAEQKLNFDLRSCCDSVLSRLNGDVKSIAENTDKNVTEWKTERQFRMTGSRWYRIFTYTENKKPNWRNKSLNYFFPKPFKATPEMLHGIEQEKHARQMYAEQSGIDVKKFGLIISAENPWLGYSPDGVVFKDDKPEKLIEIKCPYAGKTKTVEEILCKLNYIKLPQRTLKEKNSYYAQIQLGMAILNLKKTDFIIYASFDKSFIVIPVELNLSYIEKRLGDLKKAYFEHMIHNICTKETM